MGLIASKEGRAPGYVLHIHVFSASICDQNTFDDIIYQNLWLWHVTGIEIDGRDGGDGEKVPGEGSDKKHRLTQKNFRGRQYTHLPGKYNKHMN